MCLLDEKCAAPRGSLRKRFLTGDASVEITAILNCRIDIPVKNTTAKPQLWEIGIIITIVYGVSLWFHRHRRFLTDPQKFNLRNSNPTILSRSLASEPPR